MKDIKDYLHFYINSEATYSKSYVDLTDGFTLPCKLTPGRYALCVDDHSVHSIRLYLRPPSSITNEERLERGKILAETTATIEAEYHRWMLSKGFDLFGLIEAGLAIERKEN